MAALFLVLFAAFVLTAAIHVVSDQLGFLSIDCGLGANYSGYKDNSIGNLVYFSDDNYTDAGENCVVAEAAGEQHGRRLPSLQTLRSFPTGQRNCYSLPTVAGNKYLVRLRFVYGNYDNANSTSVEFELDLGSSYWDTVTVQLGQDNITKEALFVAWASWAPVCLVNTGRGTPFVSVLELRPLAAALYPPVTASQSVSLYKRLNMGTSVSLTRFPDDPHDRFWWMMVSPRWVDLPRTEVDIKLDPTFDVPMSILQTAVAPVGNDTSLTIMIWQEKSYKFMVFLHFADFQNTQLRQFNIYFNDQQLAVSYSPLYLADTFVCNSEWYRAPDDTYNITMVASSTASMLPPILNALEIYTLIDLDDTPTTNSSDFDAVMAIKLEYQVKKNWAGDPCFPDKFAWDGVKCSEPIDNVARITSVDLSNSNLHGVISQKFTLLTALKNLDLSGNNLSGSVPDSLPSLPTLRLLNLSGNQLNGPFPDSICKNHTSALVVVISNDGHTCDIKRKRLSRNRAGVIAVSVVVPGLIVAALILAYSSLREKRKPNDRRSENAPGCTKKDGEHLQNSDNRRFTYKELEKFTNNFNQLVGHGGFGLVYYGCLEDSTEVAVKMRSESSSHGLDEFLAEVQSLTKVHHRNLVSLVGYCWEDDHLSLVYEYMPQGNLFIHLRGQNGVAETLNWETRVRVVLGAAQGLEYLHKGCNLPIIHRDVKTSNILLDQNLQAKLADFGLCKTFLSDSQTHISATAAGSTGYIDPEYYHTGWLTESSDVYSFGVVLLEVATGEPPLVPGHGHIVQRVKQMTSTGDITFIADARLRGVYDISSMWKVVDTAIMCTADAGSQRPTMSTVVALLKESLALEEAHENDSSVRNSQGSVTVASVSSFGPVAR